MRTNFKKFLAMMLAVLMVMSTFSVLATAADAHKHDWKKLSTVNPTCTKQGYTWYQCSDPECNAVEARDFELANNHVESDKIIDKQPLCAHLGDAGKGHWYTKCTVCGEKMNEGSIDALEYKWITMWEEDTTCGELGATFLKCVNPRNEKGSTCDWTTEYETLTKEHSYRPAAEAKVAPTCQNYGVILYTCDEPGCPESTIEVMIAKLNCDPAPENRTKVEEKSYAATCEADGQNVYTCNECGAEIVEVIKSTGTEHTADKDAATCTEDQVCTICDEVLAPATGHGVNGYDIVYTTYPEVASCAEATVTVTCKDCGTVISEEEYTAEDWDEKNVPVVIDYTQLKHDEVKNVYVADCLVEAHIEYVCSTCGNKRYEDTDPEKGALGHLRPVDDSKVSYTIDEGVADDPLHPETMHDNRCIQVYDCARCDATDVEDAANHYHGLTHGVSADPTCFTYGVEFDTCLYCGYYKTFRTDKLVHKNPGEGQQVDAVAPSCKEVGHTAGEICDNTWNIYEFDAVSQSWVIIGTGKCGEVISGCTEIPKTECAEFSIVFNGSFPSCKAPADITVTCELCGRVVEYDEWKTWPGLQSLIQQPHDYQPVEAVAPTCTSVGYTAGSQCTKCGEYEEGKAPVEIPVSDHTPVDVPGYAATCATPGLTTGSKCSVCNVTLAYGTVTDIEPDHHPLGDYYVSIEPVCGSGEEGLISYTCSKCGDYGEMTVAQMEEEFGDKLDLDEYKGFAELIDSIREIKHTVVGDEKTIVDVTVVPTCNATGTTNYYCGNADCGKLIHTVTTPKDRNNHEVKGVYMSADKDPAVIIQDGKSYSMTPSCTANGVLWFDCNCGGYQLAEENSKLEHNHVVTEHTDKIPATCTTTGQTEKTVYTCDRTYWIVTRVNGVNVKEERPCGDTYTVGGVEIPLHGETMTYEKVEPTCTTDGYEGKVCTAEGCDYTETTVLPATGHGSKNGFNVSFKSFATCTTDGEWIIYCPDCNDFSYNYADVYQEEWYIENNYPTLEGWQVLGHKPVTDEYVAPSCTASGLTEGSHCGRCGITLTAQEPIDALGHNNYVATLVEGKLCTDNTYTITCGVCEADITNDVDWQNEWKGENAAPDMTLLEHNIVVTPGKAPTCTEGGLSDGKACDRCDYVESVQTEIPAAGHQPLIWNDGTLCEDPTHMYASTCTKTGKGFGALCSVCWQCCGADFHQDLELLAHNVVDASQTLSCTTAGFTYALCQFCGEGYGKDQSTYVDAEGNTKGLIIDYVAPLTHDWIVDLKPTCTEAGYTGAICDRCGINDPDRIPVEIPALGHLVEWHSLEKAEDTCTREIDGKVCGATVNVHGDSYVIGKEAKVYYEQEIVGGIDKCRKTTYTSDYCTDCEFKTINITFIEDLDHDLEVTRNDAPSVTGDGLKVEECKYCDYYIETVVPAIKNTIVLSGSVESKVVNGGEVVLNIDATGYNVLMSQTLFNVNYVNTVLSFNADKTVAANPEVYEFTDHGTFVTVNTVSMSGDVTVPTTGMDLVTLVFDVNCNAYDDAATTTTALSIDSVDIISTDVDAVINAQVTAIEDVVIYKNADLNGDGAITLVDSQLLLNMLSVGDQSNVQADLNCDGSVDIADFCMIQQMMLNRGDAAYVEILKGTFEY